MTTAQKCPQKTYDVEPWALWSSDWLSSLGFEQLAEHVERSGLRHSALLPSVDGAFGNPAKFSEPAGGESEFRTSDFNSGSVVHQLPRVGKYDGDSVRASRVFDGNFHKMRKPQSRCGAGFFSSMLRIIPANTDFISFRRDRKENRGIGHPRFGDFAGREQRFSAFAIGAAATRALQLFDLRAAQLNSLTGFSIHYDGASVVTVESVVIDRDFRFHVFVIFSAERNCSFDNVKTAHICAACKRKLRKCAQSCVSRWSAQRYAVRFFKDNTGNEPRSGQSADKATSVE